VERTWERHVFPRQGTKDVLFRPGRSIIRLSLRPQTRV
jgi:hypothetical protein